MIITKNESESINTSSIKLSIQKNYLTILFLKRIGF